MLAQRFESKLGTETAEFLGGVQYQHGDGPTDPVYAGKIVGGLNRFLSYYGEYSYSRLYTDEVYPGPSIRVRGSLSDFGGGLEAHYGRHRVQPYVLAGIGSVRDSVKVSIGADKSVSSSYHFGYSLGAGARFFVVRNFGFLVEAKTVDAIDIRRFDRYALGVFYRK